MKDDYTTSDIVQSLIKNSASAAISLIGTAILALWLLFQSNLVNILLPLQAKAIIAGGWFAVILLLSLSITAAYAIYLHKKIKKKPFYACSVYWDDFFTPLCPSCMKALGNFAYYHDRSRNPQPGMTCFSCNKVVRFSDEVDIFMSLAAAKEKAIAQFQNKNKKQK
jgi:hypothetical protein